MEWLSSVGPKHVALLCAVTAVGSACLLLAHIFGRYERSFVSWAGKNLRQNFIIADPKTLFIASVLITFIACVAMYRFLGPSAVIIAMIVGILGPRIILGVISRRRTRRFVQQLPDALLTLASALRAGSNLTRGLELLATRQPTPLRQEFTVVVAEHRVGRQLADSLTDMRRRMNAPELDLLGTAINVSRRVGGNLADILDELAKTLQEKAHMEGKIDALTSMGRAQGWVVSLLPIFICAVLYQQQPERMRLLFTEWYGWITLGVVAGMMALAIWMIRKIVRIDV
jgi:tight adherence protein B